MLISLSDFAQTEHTTHWSSLGFDGFKHYPDLVRAASQRNPERSAPASRTNLVEPCERDVSESMFCTDDPSDAFANGLISLFFTSH